MTSKNERYMGNKDLEKRSDDIVSTKPNTDHVVKTWRTGMRKTQLDEALMDEICTLIAAGATIPVAAAARGYANSWRNWNQSCKRDLDLGMEPGFEPGQSPYIAWGHAVREAKASFVVNCLLQISAGHPQAKALQWLLERRYPEFYMEQKKVQVAVKSEREEAQGKSTEDLTRELLDGMTPEEKLKYLGAGNED